MGVLKVWDPGTSAWVEVGGGGGGGSGNVAGTWDAADPGAPASPEAIWYDTDAVAGPVEASGTAFPPSPVAGQRFWRTDLGLECYYDGTRWLTTQVFELPLRISEASGTDGALGGKHHVPFANAYDLWLIAADMCLRVDASASGNNGTHYWTVNFRSLTANQTATVRATTNTSALTTDTTYDVSVAIGALMGTTVRNFDFFPAKTNTPGALVYLTASIRYRLVIP